MLPMTSQAPPGIHRLSHTLSVFVKRRAQINAVEHGWALSSSVRTLRVSSSSLEGVKGKREKGKWTNASVRYTLLPVSLFPSSPCPHSSSSNEDSRAARPRTRRRAGLRGHLMGKAGGSRRGVLYLKLMVSPARRRVAHRLAWYSLTGAASSSSSGRRASYPCAHGPPVARACLRCSRASGRRAARRAREEGGGLAGP